MGLDTLIVTIVRRGWGDRVLEASMRAGAEGGTIVYGRGMGIHEQQRIFGICIEPEKEIILSITSVDKTDGVLESITKAGELQKPGAGLAFVVPVQTVVGVVHLRDSNT
ncbi:MAG: P-II family nitrogen regulator [Dehalococcoidia bacterium]|nr:P-II family nitrogen regulator [Dehalococcoidia bacterium]